MAKTTKRDSNSNEIAMREDAMKKPNLLTLILRRISWQK
jgi:hypothetical protein